MNSGAISAESIVADVLNRWPETIPVFLSHRMGCVGCLMAPFETIADAARIYQIPSQSFLEALQQAALESENSNGK